VAKITSFTTHFIHTLIDRKNYSGTFLPGYNIKIKDITNNQDFGLKFIDHLAIVVGCNQLTNTIDWYNRILGLSKVFCNEYDSNNDGLLIIGDVSAMRTKVVSSSDNAVIFVLVEPVNRKHLDEESGQIQLFLKYNNGAGVQHVALYTENLVRTTELINSQKNGLELINIPPTYYTALKLQYSSLQLNGLEFTLEELEKQSLLVDFIEDDKEKATKQYNVSFYLIQTFTKSIHQQRPTLFFEFISRHGSRGFGSRNISALFKAVEQLHQQKMM